MSVLADLQKPFVRAAMKAPYLSREQEQELARAWRDARDRAALDMIVRSHLRLVIAISSRFRNYGLPMQDLIQEGTIGLMQAAERFDVDREVRFSTYASWWIRASVQEYVLKNWSIVRGGTSSNQKALFFNLRRLKAELQRSGEVTNVTQEIATRLNVSHGDVVQMEARLQGADVSLNATIGGDEAGGAREKMDSLTCEAPLPDAVTMASIDGERRTGWLRNALEHLSHRERAVVVARRLEDEAVTLETLGSRLGVSKERVRQIESRAIEKLRAALVRQEPSLAMSH